MKKKNEKSGLVVLWAFFSIEKVDLYLTKLLYFYFDNFIDFDSL
jgi:hypothetical protein